jgi:class 3 adenylate cyclase
MPLKEDLESQVQQIFQDAWTTETTTGVPDPEDLQLDNHAKNLEESTVLYADLDGSTDMVNGYQWWFSAEVYKAYLRCAARVIAAEGGTVTAYDGDRVMAIFTGDSKNTSAVRAALKINYTVLEIIRPAIKARYGNDFVMNHVVGVDTSPLHAARIGVRGYNDLVWVGRAANYAAKLTSLAGKPIWITKDVYDNMNNVVKFHGEVDMWLNHTWTAMNDFPICSTTYMHTI